jgi:hypothetical protein
MISRRVFPFDLIARVLAERLRGSTASDELLAMVHSRGVDWERIIGHASAQFVLPALAAAMRDLDLIGPGTELGAYLGAVHAANLERNSAFRAELATAVSILNEAGIEPVLLKGGSGWPTASTPITGGAFCATSIFWFRERRYWMRSEHCRRLAISHASRKRSCGARAGRARSIFTESCSPRRGRCASWRGSMFCATRAR